jgi:hypothetical protein
VILRSLAEASGYPTKVCGFVDFSHPPIVAAMSVKS